MRILFSETQLWIRMIIELSRFPTTFLSYYLINNKDNSQLRKMIDCSPQELIAQSLHNCYSYGGERGLLSNAKSTPRTLLNFCSPRKNEKISLKKVPSIAKDSIKLVKTVSQKQIPHETRIPLVVHHTQAIYRIVPQQKVMEFRIKPMVPPSRNYQKIAYARPLITYQTTQPIHRMQTPLPRIEFDRRQQSTNKMSSTVQTSHTSGSFDHYQLNLIPPASDQKISKTATQKQEMKHADKNQLTVFEPHLESLKPKIAESQFDGSEAFEDQFSEVLITYYSSAKQMKGKN